MEITILNWERYQDRKDVQHPTWFRLQNNTWASKSMFRLKPEERWVWISLLCYASQQNSSTIDIDDTWFCHMSAVNDVTLKAALRKLIEAKCISAAGMDSRECPLQTDRQTDNIVRNDTEFATSSDTGSAQPAVERVRPKFDFEALYKKYPLKKGKKKGLKVCERDIKTPADYELLSRAINIYRDECVRESRPEKYIKQFGTFMNCWEDYVDPDYGKADTTPVARILHFGIVASGGSNV